MKNPNEWVYTGETIDLLYPKEVCDWCGKTGLRYQFEIMNKNTEQKILVGSECIKKFGIEVLNEYGDRIDIKFVAQKLNRDRNEMLKRNAIARVTSSILELNKVDSYMDYQDVLDYYLERGAFTPNQLSLLVWRFSLRKIPYNIKDFKIIIRRNREKKQLLSMPDWKLSKIWICLSDSQKKWVKDNR